MIDDSERREVARRLREKSRKYARGLSSSHTSINAYHEVREVLYGTDGAPKSLCEFFDRLAGIIDPDCEEGRYSVARTVRPVDRDALLALANNLDSSASMLLKQNDLDHNRKRRGMRRDHAKSLMAASDRIREACGEAVR